MCVCVCVCVCVHTACQVAWHRPRNNIRSPDRITDKTWLNDVEVKQVNHSWDLCKANHLVTVTPHMYKKTRCLHAESSVCSHSYGRYMRDEFAYSMDFEGGGDHSTGHWREQICRLSF